MWFPRETFPSSKRQLVVEYHLVRGLVECWDLGLGKVGQTTRSPVLQRGLSLARLPDWSLPSAGSLAYDQVARLRTYIPSYIPGNFSLGRSHQRAEAEWPLNSSFGGFVACCGLWGHVKVKGQPAWSTKWSNVTHRKNTCGIVVAPAPPLSEFRLALHTLVLDTTFTPKHGSPRLG